MVRCASRAPTGPGSNALRTCARPPFALEHLHQRDALHLAYRNPKPVRTTAPGARPAALLLTPPELITKIAALVPPPRAHRHRTYGVLAPNASLRSAVAALAPAAVPPAPASVASSGEPCQRAVSRYLWAMLLARIYEVLPLSCPICHSQMRIIAFINDAGTVGEILNHIGESTQPPRSAPARGPPLWEAAAAEQLESHPRWGSSAQSAPGSEFDQRIAWQVGGCSRLMPGVRFGGPFCKSRRMPAGKRRLTATPGVSRTPRKPVGFPILRPVGCFWL